MIQYTNYNVQTPPNPMNNKDIREVSTNITQEILKEEIKSESKNEALGIYQEGLSEATPIYSAEIKQLMKNKNIEASNLNIEIVKTLDKQGVEISKQNLDIVISQLQEEHIIEMYKQGYDVETLTIDIIAQKIRDNPTLPTVEKGNKEDTDKDSNDLENYKEKIEAIKDPSSAIISKMVQSDLKVTINNLYISKHSGNAKSKENQVKEEQIISVLLANRIEITQENINATGKLIENNVEITKSRVEKYVAIEKAVNNIDVDKLISQAIEELKQGRNPEDIELNANVSNEMSEQIYEEIKQIVEDVNQFDTKVIEEASSKNEPINIGNLQKILHENVSKVVDRESVDESEDVAEQDTDKSVDNDKVITIRRQVEEIRLKLTLEAALKLQDKIDIKTESLQKVVEELKVLEHEEYKEILNDMGALPTKENIDTMKTVADAIHNIAKHQEIPVAKLVEQEIEFTIGEMDKAIRVELAKQRYEEAGTKPEGRFRETISKVEKQLEHILELNNIEATPANIKAAKALVQNDIEISEEKIESAKINILKLERLIDEMKPATVAKLLKDGVQPDTIQVDELLNHLDAMQQEVGKSATQKVAEAIVELDKTNQLSLKEKEGLVAVYRMLNTITKNETKAMGFLIKNEMELTLGNLFEAAKYVKQVGSKTGKLDINVDDDFGVLEKGEINTIRSIIAEVADANKSELNKETFKQWLSRISPEELKEYINLDKSLEDIKLTAKREQPTEIERITKQLKGLEKTSPEALAFLKEKNIPATISNIHWTDKIMKNPFLLEELTREYEALTGEKIKSTINNTEAEKLEEILDKVQEELKEQIPMQLSGSQSHTAYNRGREFEQMLNTQKEIANHDGIYQIPVQLHHGMSNLNVYVMKDKQNTSADNKDGFNAYMSIKTKNLGIIQAHMHMSGKALSFEMIGETPYATEKLQQDSNELRKAIEKIGYNVLNAEFIQREFTNPKIGKPATVLASIPKQRFKESNFEHIV